MKKEAHDLQLVKYEHYLSMEVMDLTKSLQISNSQGIARLVSTIWVWRSWISLRAYKSVTVKE